MRVSKYIHSCLLFEHEGEKLLFDPGGFSFRDGQVTPDVFADVSTVVITHDHPDHLDITALKQIVARSGAMVVGNGEVATKVGQEGIEAAILEEGTRQIGAFTLQATPADHEPILSKETPRNTAFLVNSLVLNPGDSFGSPLLAFAGVDVLVLPVMAPFLTEPTAFDFARRMRPRQIIPVHDGYAKGFFRRLRYETYGSFFNEIGIQLHPLSEPGAGIDL